MECFKDPLALLLDDPQYPDRFILIGSSQPAPSDLSPYMSNVKLALIRLISARRATSREREGI